LALAEAGQSLLTIHDRRKLMNRIVAMVVFCCLLAACGGQGLGGVKMDAALGAASDLGKAATLSDDEVKSTALQMRNYEEKHKETVVPAASKYAVRLSKLTSKYVHYDNLNLNFKAYKSDEINANASADGSVRVYTGLMDLMNDEELIFVIGHEIGHVKNGHTAKAMRTALAMSGVRKGVVASGTAAADLANSELAGLLESTVNAQFSQSQETESDDYGLQFLRKTGNKLSGAESALRKLAKLSGGKHSFLSSHPEPNERADRIAQLAK
jgi:putative metalloprotease